MTLQCKICGVSDIATLSFIINYQFPPRFVGFIVNYPKSKRFVKIEKLKELMNINKKKTKFVAVLVKPDDKILKKIENLNFDYYQIYDCSPSEVKRIKIKYNVKIISAITVENREDVLNYKKFVDCSDIILFDSKGYEKSLDFNHELIKNVPSNINKMLAGNIKHDDNLVKFSNICDYIDISGGLETSGLKDISKVRIFLDTIKKLND
ncbi:MAG: phosphoribosylanthranilate isomerase [Rickettsiales bacterium TMED289]|nr:MAG: phosphoribosylanthranilate isomerase [Rickettsiales bacterium TMED289]|tara:strand:- start:705 stop:1328 length:624 start_codon:yes stop_codon:yes gene_type:complete